MSEAEVLSTEDLRNRMFEVLKKRGLIDVLKVRQLTVAYYSSGQYSGPTIIFDLHYINSKMRSAISL